MNVSARILQKSVSQKYTLVHKWGPSAFGLALIPALPVTVDHPVEHAVDWAFDKYDPFKIQKTKGGAHTGN